MMDSTNRWKNWCWCGLDLDLRTKTSVTLVFELVASSIGIIGFLLSEEGGAKKIYQKSVRDIIGLILTCFTELSVFICISAGLYGLYKKKPSLLAPYLICKSYYFIGIFMGIILSWSFLMWYMNVIGFCTVLIPGALLLLLKIHSTVVVYTCYKEMGEDLRRQATLLGPELASTDLQYNAIME